MKKILLGIIASILFLVLLLFQFNSISARESAPFPLISAAVKLAWNNSDIEAITGTPEKYLVKITDGIDPVITLMETRGWHFKEQMGSGIVFVRQGELMTVGSRMFTNKYMIISVPRPDYPVAGKDAEIISLVAAGDILMHNTVIAAGKHGDVYNFDQFFTPVKHLIEEGDYASVDLETALAGPSTGYTGYPAFNSPDNIADALKSNGFDLVVTANNHTMDRGYQGALRTLDVLRQAGLDTSGTYKTAEEKKNFLIKDIRGVKVGFLTYSYGTNGIALPSGKPYFFNSLDRDKVMTDITALRPNVDLLVLILHWGVEYSPYPTEQQRKLAIAFFQQGADVILGSHPHVIQPMEVMKINGQDKFVIYSMGNFMGNQIGVERNSGVILNLRFTKSLPDGPTVLTRVTSTPTFIHPYYVNGRRLFRVVPVEETMKAIKEGQDPYLGEDSLPLLQQVLDATNQTLNHSLQ